MAEPAESPARARLRRADPAVTSVTGEPPVRTMRDHVGVLRRRALVIGVTAAAAVLIALVVSMMQPTRYQATVEVLVPPQTPLGDINQVLAQRPVDPNRAIQDESRIAVAADVSEQVRQRTDGSVSLAAKNVKDTDVIQVTATAASADRAAAGANAAAEIYLAKHNGGLSKGTSPAVVLQPAAVPSSPSQPTTIRNLVLALIAGLLVGVALAYAVDAFDDE